MEKSSVNTLNGMNVSVSNVSWPFILGQRVAVVTLPEKGENISFQVYNRNHSEAVAATRHAGLGPTKGDEKPRVVVLGSGWAGCRLIKDIDTKVYDVVCVSPTNHMVFTPLLASTCVGTLEFRSVAEPIGRIQPAVSREPGSYFFLGKFHIKVLFG
ncbi:unnamed protein product [Ilex paraguariensis]|uniref:Uncharacterized protein n=1 Tax=Ilex paraguariensis TaxID=185542 RepID=A0ABC8T444_9AQUA